MTDYDDYKDLPTLLQRYLINVEDHSKVINLIERFEPVNGVKLKIGKEAVALLDIEDIEAIARKLELPYKYIMYPYKFIEAEDPLKLIEFFHSFLLEVASTINPETHRPTKFKDLLNKIRKDFAIHNSKYTLYFLKHIILKSHSNREIMKQYLKPIYERKKPLEGEEPFEVEEEGEIKEEDEIKPEISYFVRKNELPAPKFHTPKDENVKSLLHELCIKLWGVQPKYESEEVPRPYPTASKRFRSSVSLNDQVIASISNAEAKNCRKKKDAELKCAHRAYDKLVVD